MTKPVTRRSFIQTGLIAGASIAYAPWAFSTNTAWQPTRPVRVIVPYPPGGATDVVARLVCEGLKDRFDQPFIVENRSGAGGSIGTAHVAAAAGDGHTILLTISSSLMINQFQYKNLPFDPRKDLKLVTLLTHAPVGFCVPTSLNVSTFAEFVDYTAANKSKMSYGSYGNGSYSHMVLEHLNQTLKANMPHIPYRGEAAVIQALMAEEVQVGVSSAVNAGPQAAAGSIKVIGLSGTQRIAALPNVPTLTEQGIDDPVFSIIGWLAVAAPGTTSPVIVETLSQEINRIIQSKDITTRLENNLGLIARGTTPTEFEEIYNNEYGTWKAMFENSGAQVIS